MKSKPPGSDEFEISVFGPGIGECIVLHVGSGHWYIIDSCLDQNRDPVALSYLTEIGVPASSVDGIVVTHWHEDHYLGAAKLLSECQNATFFCSSVMGSEELASVLISGKDAEVIETRAGIPELSEIFDILLSRKSMGIPSNFRFVSEYTTLHKSRSQKIHLSAMSPSSMANLAALREIRAFIPKPDQVIRRLPRLNGPNAASVVLSVRVGSCKILLGGDLEMSTDPEMGWQRIIDLEAGNSHSFEAMKVAHHGSANADHAHIWSNLLIEGPLAILTPYGRGRSPLPQKADVVRIKERAKSVYITKNPSTVSSKPQRDPGVERQMSRICKTRRSISRAPGQVRIRARISDGLISPTIELFEGAAQL